MTQNPIVSSEAPYVLKFIPARITGLAGTPRILQEQPKIRGWTFRNFADALIKESVAMEE